MSELVDARFRVISKLGEGGMATVYLVENVRAQRQEALKVLHARVSDSAAIVGRFRREARAISRLAHRNIVSLYEFGRLADGALYLTTEYADGASLDATLRHTGPLAVPLALDVLVQLASALDHAHARGVIHRDLKPSNLLVSEAGELKVIDFGIAKITATDYSDSFSTTSSRELCGTPAYMAPEQIAGAHDPRTDLYAAGCIAFELLIGEKPFSGPLPTVIHHHLETPPPHAAELQPAVPLALDAVIMRCLEKDPDRRFQTGAELVAALENVPGYRGEKRYDDLAGSTELAKTMPAHDSDPADVAAGSDALVHAAAEALLIRTGDTELAASLTRIATLEVALDAIEAELVSLSQQSDAIEDEHARTELTDRAIALAARKAEQEEEIAAELEPLRVLVESVASRYEADRLVHDLLAKERALRMLEV
jgi:serine/threonine-protein kinase